MEKKNIQNCKKVSVIIPNYNKKKYIANCIESVIMQTYKNIEIIVVDDCSTDESRKIINEFVCQYDNIVPVLLSENGGVCNARNIGAEVSSGDYLTFLDSDDVYINEKKIENELKEIKNDKDIAFSQWVPLDIDGNVLSNAISRKNIYSSRYGVCKILSTTRPGYQQLRGYVFSKELFSKVGGYTFPYNYFEDFDFQCRLALNGNLKYTKEYGEGYRNVPGGLSKQKVLDANVIINRIQTNYYKELHVDQKIYYKMIFVKKSMSRKIMMFLSKSKLLVFKVFKCSRT